MSTDAVTPPEKCPICGEKVDPSRGVLPSRWKRVDYKCGLMWIGSENRYAGECDNATAACLSRLEPTPLEAARQALVDAALRWNDADQGSEPLDDMLFDAVAAYRALLERQP